MKEQLINFETAKLAKDRGFDLVCLEPYYEGNKEDGWDSQRIERPTQSLLQKWLREEYNTNIWVSCTPYLNSYTFNYNLNKEIITDVIKYVNYEEVLEKGLQEALKFIIND
jgi:hypothetical protein